MSDLENGLRSAMRGFLVLLAIVIFGPYLVMLVAAWLLDPRTGSWGAWPHIVGGGWALLVVGSLVIGWLRR